MGFFVSQRGDLMTKGADLYRLQKLDSEREAKQRRLAEVKAALEDESELQRARQALDSAKKHAQQLMIRQRDLELEVDGLSDKMSSSQDRLYSGEVTNPKELADLQAEVSSLKRRRQKKEDDLLTAMIEREEADEARDQAESHLAEVKSRRADQQVALKAEREELQARLAEIEQERADLLSHIDAGDLSTYKRLWDAKDGLVVVNVRDGACSGCGVTISPSVEWEMRQGGPVSCDNCGRILVNL
jgi:hypothetical protein